MSTVPAEAHKQQSRFHIWTTVLGLTVAGLAAIPGWLAYSREAGSTTIVISEADLPPLPGSTEAEEACAATLEDEKRLVHGPDRPVYYDGSEADPPYLAVNVVPDNEIDGDERNFVRVKSADPGAPLTDRQEVLRGGTYIVRAVAHVVGPADGATEGLNAAFSVPSCTGRQIPVTGLIRASNTWPSEVFDSAVFWSQEDFNVVYVPDSAKYYTSDAPEGGFLLSKDLLTSTGELLGMNERNGIVAPGYANLGYIEFQVRPQFAPVDRR